MKCAWLSFLLFRALCSLGAADALKPRGREPAADRSIWAQQKCSLFHFYHERKRGEGVCACVMSYDQNLLVLGFCCESVISEGAQFDLVECI